MRIAYLFGGFKGGAPLSFSEYVRIATSKGHEAIVFTSDLKGAEIVRRYGAQVVEVPGFRFHRPDQVWRAYSALLKELKFWKPAVIHVNRTSNYPVARALGGSLGLPVIYTYADSTVQNRRWLKGLNDAIVTTYCAEYRERLSRNGLDTAGVQIWPQRFDFGDQPLDLSALPAAPPYRCALVGRLDSEKIGSIRAVLDFVEKALASGISLTLDILGDGHFREEVDQRVAALNATGSRTVARAHGYLTHPGQVLADVHLVFGKARSVIEPVVCGKLGVVVAETGQMAAVTPDRIDFLAEANFSGRNLVGSDSVDRLCTWIAEEATDSSNRQLVARRMWETYDARALVAPLLATYNEAAERRSLEKPMRTVRLLMQESVISAVSYVRGRILP